MNLWTKIKEKLKDPPAFMKAINFITTIILCTLALLILLIDYENSALSIIAYTLFSLAALSLSYSVYLIIIIAPRIKKSFIAWMEKHDFTYLLLRNFGFRTVVFAIVSFAMSIIFSCFNAYMGIVNRSIWYGALATYYIALAFMRGGILTHHGKRIGKKRNAVSISEDLTKAKLYRNSGIVLLILNIALSSAIGQMIFSDAHFTYAGLTIFAFAAYAFYKITMSIINLIRANKQTDLTVKAIRNVNLADATVSILALQTALLTTFSDDTLNASLMNTITGVIVSVICIGLGVYMVISANKKIKEILLKEKLNDEQRTI